MDLRGKKLYYTGESSSSYYSFIAGMRGKIKTVWLAKERVIKKAPAFKMEDCFWRDATIQRRIMAQINIKDEMGYPYITWVRREPDLSLRFAK